MSRDSTAAEGTDLANPTPKENADPLCVAYRHDIHKLFGRSHESAHEQYAGVRVNEQVPLGADADAALLSRPAGEPEQTVTNHCSPSRLSLVTGSTASEAEQLEIGNPGFDQLVVLADAQQLHAEWLTTTVASAVNESVFYPYTSLKFHTLLVGALLDNYRAGYDFGELSLVATAGSSEANDGRREAAIDSDAVRPHRTVCWTPALTLTVTGEPGNRPSTPLGAYPARSFADVWSRLPDHPVDTNGSREARLLDAQLRRVRSWSTALQYIEETTRGLGPLPAWGESHA